MLQSMAAAAERVFEFLAEPEEDQKADPARRVDSSVIDGHVDFHHVRFGYTPDKVVIHDFSCHVEPGQKVAIVGPHRRRKDHHGQAADALLRRGQRRHHPERPQCAGL